MADSVCADEKPKLSVEDSNDAKINGVRLQHLDELQPEVNITAATPDHSPKDGSSPPRSGYTIVELRGSPRNSDELLMKKLKVENSASDDNSEASGAGENSANAAKLVLLPRNTVVKRVLSIHEKLEICERAKTGEKKTKLAREYGVQPPAITKVVQNERKWQAFMANSSEAGAGAGGAAENGSKKRGRKRARLMNVNANATAIAIANANADADANETEQDGTTLGLVGSVGSLSAVAAIVGGFGGVGNLGGMANAAERNMKFEKSEYGTGIGLGGKRLSSSSTLRMERSFSVASKNGFGAHACTPEHAESPSTGELSSSFAAAIGGARTCLEVLTRLNANLVAQAGHGSPNGSGTSASTTARTNGGSAPHCLNGSASDTSVTAAATATAAAAPVNIVPVHWIHALFQIEHFFSLLAQQQSQMESQ